MKPMRSAAGHPSKAEQQPPPRLPVYLTTAEVASLLRYTETTVRRLARAGTLPGFRFGRAWRFSTGVILRAFHSHVPLRGH